MVQKLPLERSDENMEAEQKVKTKGQWGGGGNDTNPSVYSLAPEDSFSKMIVNCFFVKYC